MLDYNKKRKLYTLYYDDCQYFYSHSKKKMYYGNTNRSFSYSLTSLISLSFDSKFNCSPLYLIDQVFNYYYYLQKDRVNKRPLTAANLTKKMIKDAYRVAKENPWLTKNTNPSYFHQAMKAIDSVSIEEVKENKKYIINEYRSNKPEVENLTDTKVWIDLIKEDGLISLFPIFSCVDSYINSRLSKITNQVEYNSLLFGNKRYDNSELVIPDFETIEFSLHGYYELEKAGYICE